MESKPLKNPMAPDEFSETLGRLCMSALNGGLPASMIIGNLEIAKLTVDRLLYQAQLAAQRKNVAETILPPNGIKLPRRQ